ncbi:MAG: hypothetical protein PF961_14235 [Planctomycetota bacterium]|jgi:hypothetical protein|nr:hypothetical protein [Planctomycetota bacterium]
MAGRPRQHDARVAYTVRLPPELLDQAKDAATHYGMTVTDFFVLAIQTTYGQLEDRDGPIPQRGRTATLDVSDLADALRKRAQSD